MSVLDLARKVCDRLKARRNGRGIPPACQPEEGDKSDQSPAADQEAPPREQEGDKSDLSDQSPAVERKCYENQGLAVDPGGPSAEQKGDQSPPVLPLRRWYAPGHEGLETPFDDLPEL
jgi:hypothetical protein